jgi:hypothetical protein
MSVTARPGSTLRTDSVAYAVWLAGQSPRVSDQEAVSSILRRYPELTLGEAEHIRTQAQEQLMAGTLLMALPAGESLGDEQIPDSGRGGSGYRTQVDVTIPSSDGTATQRTVIIEEDTSPTPDSVIDAIIDAVNELCGEYEGLAREKCLEWLMGDVTVARASVSRGH